MQGQVDHTRWFHGAERINGGRSGQRNMGGGACKSAYCGALLPLGPAGHWPGRTLLERQVLVSIGWRWRRCMQECILWEPTFTGSCRPLVR